MKKVGGNINAEFQSFSTIRNEIGEEIQQWTTVAQHKGWLDLSSGNSSYKSFNAKTEEVVLARLYQFEALNVSNSVQFNIRNDAQGFTRRFMNHYLMADGSRFTDIDGNETMFYTEETKGRDPRMAQTVLCPGYIAVDETATTPNDMTSLTGYEPIKFVASAEHSGASKGTCDWPLIRAAEVYLNYAEAVFNYLGSADATDATFTMSAVDAVNVIRSRSDVNMPAFPDEMSNDEFTEKYRRERMVVRGTPFLGCPPLEGRRHTEEHR